METPASGPGDEDVDGRVKRATDNFRSTIRNEINPEYLDVIDLSDERLRTATTIQEKNELSECVKETMKDITNTKNESLHAKMEASRGKRLMAEDMAQLDKNSRSWVRTGNLRIR